MTATETRTTCPYCGVGCGVIASSRDDARGQRRARRSRSTRPTSAACVPRVRRCADTARPRPPRLLHPRGARRASRASWDAALGPSRPASSRDVIDKHGPDAVAFYVSGQLLTEDYYVANKLMKGFLGSANIDTNSRLCMASAVAGHKRAFGTDTVPGCYEDLERAKLVVLVGSNAAWCHPVLYQRLVAGQAGPPRAAAWCVIDPRRTATADMRRPAPRHPRPAPTPALFNGLLHVSVRARRDPSRCSSASTPKAWTRHWPPRATSHPDVDTVARVLRAAAAQVRAVLRAVRPHRARGHAVLAGREPVLERHRQGQRASSTATCSPAASAAPAWVRSRSPASRTPWAGARSAGSPTSWPRTSTSTTRRTVRW
ncbi:MAG: molybdopterin-dependent oxidoreductase [Comamonadaceae bacterium]|nr:molybdopterin-dependent oxidoreductase [Comamonadaceae bacterium]